MILSSRIRKIVSLTALSALRELLGRGTLLGVPVLSARYEPWVFMVLPPGGFFALGLLLLSVAWVAGRRKRKAHAR